MELYNKDEITIDLYKYSIVVRDESNAGYIDCPLNNVTKLLKGLCRMRKDPSNYRNQNCFNGHEFFPTIDCEGNYIILTHIPKIITAIKSSSKMSFKLNKLHELNLPMLEDINECLKNSSNIIKKNDNIDIIFYNI